MADYSVKDIKTLEGIEAIRLRPGMYACQRNKSQFHRFCPGIGPEWKIDFYQFL